MQRALFAGILIGIMCSIIGTFLVLKRLSLLGDGLAHLAFGGIALGLLFGINPIVSTLAVTSIGALGVQKLIERAKVYGDSATAVILSFGVGLAVVIIGMVNGFTVNLFSFLVGSILALSPLDLALISLMFFIVLLLTILLYKKLVFISFNEEIAKTSGIRVSAINSLFAILTAVTVVVAIKAVGILLVSSLLVLPTLISLQISRSFKGTLALSCLVSVTAVLFGTIISFYADLPPGGVIVLTLCGFFLLTLGCKRAYSLVRGTD